MKRRKREPELLGDVVKRVIPGAAEAGKLERARRKWRATVGDRISSLTRVVSFRYGTLKVAVFSAPLLSELEFVRAELVEELAEGEDALVLKDLKFSLKEE